METCVRSVTRQRDAFAVPLLDVTSFLHTCPVVITKCFAKSGSWKCLNTHMEASCYTTKVPPVQLPYQVYQQTEMADPASPAHMDLMDPLCPRICPQPPMTYRPILPTKPSAHRHVVLPCVLLRGGVVQLPFDVEQQRAGAVTAADRMLCARAIRYADRHPLHGIQ
jgi:hypothetical protein